jgi:hypothetical protein
MSPTFNNNENRNSQCASSAATPGRDVLWWGPTFLPRSYAIFQQRGNLQTQRTTEGGDNSQYPTDSSLSSILDSALDVAREMEPVVAAYYAANNANDDDDESPSTEEQQ